MSVKHLSLCALVLTLLGVGAAGAQTPAMPYGPPPGDGPPPQPGEMLTPQGPPPAQGLSSWILYNQPCCCWPLGNRQPMRYELYLRAGPSFPIEGEIFGRTLDTGWAIQGGARLLLMNLPQTAAWTVDLSLSNIHNNGRRRDVLVNIDINDVIENPNFDPNFPIGPFNQPNIVRDEPVAVAIRALNRTGVNLAIGRERYLIGDASCNGPAWRVGFDGGGSWGTGKVEFTIIRHRTDVYSRLFAAVHSDLEVPFGCCIFTAGCRAEWGYSWSDLLQNQNDGNMQEILLLGTIGIRF